MFDCSTPEGRADGVQKATDAVRSGKLVVLPTDTLYGIGCDAFAAEAVADLLAAKGRGREMPPPVLVPDARTVDGLATDVPAYARALIEEFWPGPLTVVLRSQPSLHWDLGETNGTVAVRMPDDELALEVLRAIGPMAVSSANRTGYPAAKDILDAATQLGAAVQVYLDGGPVRGGLASTIVDCTGEEPEILREGALGADVVEAVVARVRETESADAEPDTDPADEPTADEPAEDVEEPVVAPDEPTADEESTTDVPTSTVGADQPTDDDDDRVTESAPGPGPDPGPDPIEFTSSPAAKESTGDE